MPFWWQLGLAIYECSVSAACRICIHLHVLSIAWCLHCRFAYRCGSCAPVVLLYRARCLAIQARKKSREDSIESGSVPVCPEHGPGGRLSDLAKGFGLLWAALSSAAVLIFPGLRLDAGLVGKDHADLKAFCESTSFLGGLIICKHMQPHAFDCKFGRIRQWPQRSLSVDLDWIYWICILNFRCLNMI